MVRSGSNWFSTVISAVQPYTVVLNSVQIEVLDQNFAALGLGSVMLGRDQRYQAVLGGTEKVRGGSWQYSTMLCVMLGGTKRCSGGT